MAKNTQQQASSNGFITAEELFKEFPLREEVVTLPNGKKHRVRELSGTEREDLDTLATKKDEKGKEETDYRLYRARAIAMASLNENGSPMFPKWKDAVDQISMLPGSIIDLIFKPIGRMSGLTKESQNDMGKGTGETTGTISSRK